MSGVILRLFNCFIEILCSPGDDSSEEEAVSLQRASATDAGDFGRPFRGRITYLNSVLGKGKEGLAEPKIVLACWCADISIAKP